MILYPVNLNLAGRQCIVVGGGKVAARKVGDLLECGAGVRVISPELDEGFQGLAGFDHEPRGYREGDLEGAFLAIAATDDAAVNTAVVAEAQNRAVMLNVVDQPELCDFQVPASIRRGELLLTVSSGGLLPALSKRLRRQLEAEFPEEWGRVLELLGEARARVVAGVEDEQRKRDCLAELAGLNLVETLRQGGEEAVMREIDTCISRY